MGRKKIFKDVVIVSVSIEREYYEHLKKQSRIMMAAEDKNLALTEVIRRGLELAYPLPNNQMRFIR